MKKGTKTKNYMNLLKYNNFCDSSFWKKYISIYLQFYLHINNWKTQKE